MTPHPPPPKHTHTHTRTGPNLSRRRWPNTPCNWFRTSRSTSTEGDGGVNDPRCGSFHLLGVLAFCACDSHVDFASSNWPFWGGEEEDIAASLTLASTLRVMGTACANEQQYACLHGCTFFFRTFSVTHVTKPFRCRRFFVCLEYS